MSEKNVDNTTKEHAKKGKKKWLLLLLLLLLLISAGGTLFYHFFYRIPEKVVANVKDVDNEFIEKMTSQQLKDFLQSEADKDYVQLKVDTQMHFSAKDELGTVNIQNPPANEVGIRVQTFIKDTKQLVYDSGVIKPKEFVSKGHLTTELSPGEYETDSKVVYYDLKDGEAEGESAFVGTLIVD